MRELKKPHFSMAGWGLFLAGALTLSSCSNEDLPGGEEQGPAIEFGEVKTRAEVTESTQVRDFSVFAEQNYLDENGEDTNDFISLLDNERVYRISEEESADFTYDNKRYWVEGRTFNFFAVYPYMESGVERASFKPGEVEYDGYTIDFTTPYTADTDLMASHYIKPGVDAIPDYVEFSFSHLLSKICFVFKKDADKNANDKFTVTEVSISGIRYIGKYNSSRWENYADNWSLENSTRVFRNNTLSASINKTSADPEGVNAFGEGNGWLLLPQTIESGKVGLYISYQYTQEGSSETLAKQIQTTLPSGIWETGKQYKYNITLSVDNLIYISTPTVESWGAMHSCGTIIIK